MNSGTMRKTYDIMSGGGKPRKEPSVAGEIRIWLRAGHSRFLRNELIIKFRPWGIDADEFIALFDAASRDISGMVVPVTITVYDDDTYDFRFGRISRIQPPLSPQAMDPFRPS